MQAYAWEYRFRYAVHTVIYALGFLAPWNYLLHLDPPGPNAHMWGILAVAVSRLGFGDTTVAFNVVLSAAILCAFAGAWLRTWGGAYLGASVVQSRAMHMERGVLQDGPFRYVRNPLYLGTFLHTLALSILMPRSGAIFTVAAIGLLQVRLILAEEPFLLAKLGASYAAYCALVPRLLPSLRPRVMARRLQPRWAQAAAGEIYFWGVAASFAFAGWMYHAWLLLQCVLVSFGVSLVVMALTPKRPSRN